MDGLLKKHLLVICIILQITQCIYSQTSTVELTTIKENLLIETATSQEENIDIDNNMYVLSKEESELEENLLSVTTISPQGASCLDECLNESNEKRCLCDCNTGEVLNDCGTTLDSQVVEELTTIAAIEENEEEVQSEEPKLIPCQVLGEVQATAESCSTYDLCLPTEKGLHWSEQQCPEGLAFNSLLKRCSRDLHKCTQDMPQCSRSGTFPDVTGNNSYIWCIPQRTALGWHKYRVRCAAYEVFLPTLGSCFIDVQKLNSGVLYMHEARDVDMIKAELAEIKVLEKQKQKEEKLKLKMQKKQEKLLIKKAIKDAQERAKLEGTDSAELKDFLCLHEGAFPSTLGTQFYNNCVLKKGKLKALTMMCAMELQFNEESGSCM